MAPNETVTVTLISLLMQRIYSQRTDEAAEMLAFRMWQRSDNSEEQPAITASKQRK